MNALARLQGLSISARSFLLVLAALIVAEGIGLILLITRPPQHNPPVELWQVAERLRLPQDGPAPDGRRDAGPPPDNGDWGRGPPREGGPRFGGGPPPPRDRPPDLPHEVQVSEVAAAPEPHGRIDMGASEQVAGELAAWLGVTMTELRVHIPARRQPPPARGGPLGRLLGEGFSIARRLPDGRWLEVTSPPEPFPNAFQRQTLALLAIGLALLLPLAWLFARALAAPIRRFADAAHRLGQDPSAQPLPSTGPREMRAAVDAFNTMQTRINRLLRERTQMFAAVAHDLRTPLTRLAFRLEDLPAPLNQKVAADIQEMKDMIEAALGFIRDRQVVNPRERLDLRSLLDRIVDEQGDLGHEVSFEEGAPVIIAGEPLALRRMLVNLVENALKYGQRARLRLYLADGMATVEIDDDGPGIPQNRQEQVFEPFFRLENSRNRDTGGIGLGLTSARAIAVDHGGDITLGNRGGGGLRVTVRLPLPES